MKTIKRLLERTMFRDEMDRMSCMEEKIKNLESRCRKWYYRSNKEKWDKSRKIHKKDSDRIQKNRKYMRAYYWKHREERLAYQKKYDKTHKSK